MIPGLGQCPPLRRNTGLAQATYIGEAHYGSVNGQVVTFANQPIGNPSADRLVVVLVNGEGFGGYVTGVTIGGQAAALDVHDYDNDTAVYMCQRKVATGSTATVVVTWSDAEFSKCAIIVFNIKGQASDTPYHFGTGSPVALNVPDGGCVIAGFHNDSTGGVTFTGVTENLDHLLSTDQHGAGSINLTNGEIGRSVGCSPAQSFAAASWG